MKKDNNEIGAEEISKEKADKLSSILAKLSDETFRKNFKDDPVGTAKKENIEIDDVYFLPVGASFTMDVRRYGECMCSGCGCCCLISAGKELEC